MALAEQKMWSQSDDWTHVQLSAIAGYRYAALQALSSKPDCAALNPECGPCRSHEATTAGPGATCRLIAGAASVCVPEVSLQREEERISKLKLLSKLSSSQARPPPPPPTPTHQSKMLPRPPPPPPTPP
eukprot:6194188-Pleurochrysis_carterae.AAC.2